MSWLNLMTVTCWGLDQTQKREPDNPHCDPEELFSSPPIYQKLTPHPKRLDKLIFSNHFGSHFPSVHPNIQCASLLS